MKLKQKIAKEILSINKIPKKVIFIKKVKKKNEKQNRQVSKNEFLLNDIKSWSTL